jgi:hypothetical protein
MEGVKHGKILEKARMILRNVYAAFGAAAMPFLIHAMYGVREKTAAAWVSLGDSHQRL